MRRILIDDNVSAIATDYLYALKDKRTLRWREMPMARLKIVYDALGEQDGLRCYVSSLMMLYDRIVLLHSSEFTAFHDTYFSLWDAEDLNTNVKIKKNEMPFYQAIQWAMRYEDVRSSLLPSYLGRLQINACVYCNEVSIASGEKTDNGNHEVWARYEVDHFYPKDKYPYLSTSFYNFQPSCSNCNGSKSNKMALFNLYTDDAGKQDVFRFSIGDADQIVEARTQCKPDALDIRLTANEKGLQQNHDDLFHVESVYQKDHRRDAWRIMEILYDHEYSYIKGLKAFLGGHLTGSDHDILMGYFKEYDYDMNKDMVHKKPLNKLAQDIVEFYEEK